MPRSVLLLSSLAAVLLLGAAVVLLRSGAESSRATETATLDGGQPVKPARSVALPPSSPPSKTLSAEGKTTPPARLRPKAPMELTASGPAAIPGSFVVDPDWAPPLRASAESCEQVIDRLDAALSQSATLSAAEKENLVAAANDNLNWFRDFVDKNDANQVRMLAQARAVMLDRLIRLGLQLPRDAGQLSADGEDGDEPH